MRLAGEADWRNGVLAPFCITTWATAHRFPYRRARRALDRVATSGLCSFELVAFGPGHLQVARLGVLHDRGRSSERFVQLSLSALDALVGEHGLDWLAEATLVALVVRVDDRDWTWAGTLASLGPELGVGHRSLARALRQLGDAGLIEDLVIAPGAGTSCRVAAGPALVVAPPPRAPRRPERRRLAHPGAHGPAADLARALLSHHDLGASASPALVSALGQALATGASSEAVLEAMAARGHLGGAGDPMAVLVHRAQVLAAELARVAAAESARREAHAAARAAEAARAEAQRAEATRGAEESAWLARVLSEEDLGTLLRRLQPRAPARALPPAGLDAAIRTWARQALRAHPGLDAESALAAELAGEAPAGEALAGDVASETSPDPGPVDLPRARDGPTLAERLRRR